MGLEQGCVAMCEDCWQVWTAAGEECVSFVVLMHHGGAALRQ
jgi:hypothetical protein